VVLFTLAGIAAWKFLDIRAGVAAGVLAGLVTANFVPVKKKCG